MESQPSLHVPSGLLSTHTSHTDPLQLAPPSEITAAPTTPDDRSTFLLWCTQGVTMSVSRVFAAAHVYFVSCTNQHWHKLRLICFPKISEAQHAALMSLFCQAVFQSSSDSSAFRNETNRCRGPRGQYDHNCCILWWVPTDTTTTSAHRYPLKSSKRSTRPQLQPVVSSDSRSIRPQLHVVART